MHIRSEELLETIFASWSRHKERVRDSERVCKKYFYGIIFLKSAFSEEKLFPGEKLNLNGFFAVPYF